MRSIARRLFLIALCVACLLHLTTSPSPAEDSEFNLNWYFSTAFGTGYYKVDSAEVAVLRIPFSFRLQEATDQYWGIKLLFPVTVGFGGVGDNDPFYERVALIAVAPGVEVEMPVSPSWMVTPFFNFGAGWEFLNGGTAAFGAVGVRSRYHLSIEQSDVTLGGSLIYSGARNDKGNADTLSSFGIGVEWISPWTIDADQSIRVGMHVIHNWYFNDLEFLLPGNETVSLKGETEIGLLTAPKKPWDVLGFKVERLGVGFLFGPNLTGVRLITSFPF
ncbi:MAG TPA: hypothetical protein VN260_07315 [Dissulfurispiraceae bacterium]|nr:hypothetical protein [Dissulfurispiraceae bacterium]